MAEQELKACPLQVDRHSRAGPLSIPWPIAEKAYSEYARRYGTSQSLARIAERGGFSWGEMDMLYPAWRTDTDAISALTARLASAEAEATRRERNLSLVALAVESAEGCEAVMRQTGGTAPEDIQSLLDGVVALRQTLASAEAEVERLRAEVDAMGLAMLRIRRDAVTIDDAMTIIDPFDLTAAARRQQGGTDAR